MSKGLVAGVGCVAAVFMIAAYFGVLALMAFAVQWLAVQLFGYHARFLVYLVGLWVLGGIAGILRRQ